MEQQSVKRLLIALTFFWSVCFAQELKIKTGTYTGNGTTQSITGIGFLPKVVIVKGDIAGQFGAWKAASSNGDTSQVTRGAAISNGITSLNADGFTVGDSSIVNNISTTYYYIALGGQSVTTGAYTGTGSELSVETPWQIGFFMLHQTPGTTIESYIKTRDMSGQTAQGVLTPNNTFGTYTIGGIDLTATFSASGKKYVWFAIENNSLFLNNISYTGTGVADTISTTFEPSVVLLKRSSSSNAIVFRTDSYGDANCGHFWNTANISGTITDILSNGFVLGTSSNSNASGATYYAVYLKNYVAPEATKTGFGGYSGRYKGWGKY